MGSVLRIYSGGAQVSLYDATNGLLHCGYTTEDILVKEERTVVGLSDGNKIPLRRIPTFEARLLQTDSTVIDDLISRQGILQEVYIIGLDCAYKFSDVIISFDFEGSMKPGEIFTIMISASRVQQAKTPAANLPESYYCQFIQNILGAFGNMNVDGGAGVATGWVNDGGTPYSVEASYLGGGYGNNQLIAFADAGDFIYCRVRFPLDQLPIRLTASAYVDNTQGGTSYFAIGFRTADSAGAVVDTKVEEKTLANGADGRQSYSLEFTPGADVQFVDIIIRGSALGTASIQFDNAQLEIGNLTSYVENA